MSDERKPIARVTVEHLETGETETAEIPRGDYFILVTEPAYVAHTNAFLNGTHVVTIKGRTV